PLPRCTNRRHCLSWLPRARVNRTNTQPSKGSSDPWLPDIELISPSGSASLAASSPVVTSHDESTTSAADGKYRAADGFTAYPLRSNQRPKAHLARLTAFPVLSPRFHDQMKRRRPEPARRFEP